MAKYHDPPGHIDWLTILIVVLWAGIIVGCVVDLFMGRWYPAGFILVLALIPILLPILLMWSTERSKRKHPERWY